MFKQVTKSFIMPTIAVVMEHQNMTRRFVDYFQFKFNFKNIVYFDYDIVIDFTLTRNNYNFSTKLDTMLINARLVIFFGIRSINIILRNVDGYQFVAYFTAL